MKMPQKMRGFSRPAKLIVAVAIGLLSQVAPAAHFPEPGDFARGAKAWAENCNRCHNMRNADEMRDDQWTATMFHMRLRAGLSGQETRDIITFLQASNASLSPAEVAGEAAAAAGTGLSGEAIYRQTCVACHGADGKGTLPGVPDLTDRNGRLAKTDTELMRNILNGFQSPGSAMAMPAKGGNSALTQGDIAEVLRYLREAFFNQMGH